MDRLNKVELFFSAWALTDSVERKETIGSAVSESILYDDPRTQNSIEGVDALSDYVGMFSENAPGWSAKVVKSDTTACFTRVTVAFGGPGPEGKEIVQYGQYFVESKGDEVVRMVGFVGTGE